MFGKLKRIHFVGIGGVGMSGIALVLRNLGFEVSGSDLRATDLTKSLIQQGIDVFYGHRPENCLGADVLVYSSAIAKDNIELITAQTNRTPVIPRAEMLAELMRMKYSIAISGSHGKTTVTSMISTVLEKAGFDPTTVIGGRILGKEAGAKLGKSEYLVAEADESDRSFLLLYPTIAVITNIEREHLDYYKDLADIKRAFVKFANKVPFYGTVILCADSPAVRQICPKLKRPKITYGFSRKAKFNATDIQLKPFSSEFLLVVEGKKIDRFGLNVPGIHNVENSLAAIAVAKQLDIGLDTVKAGLNEFSGVHRRMERIGEKSEIKIFDDYAHHPTEIQVTLRALRNAFPKNRLIGIFQPHRYTRTKFLADDFGACFSDCDLLIITEIYAASEPSIPGVSAMLIVDAVKAHNSSVPQVLYIEDRNKICGELLPQLREGDVVITLGAGNIWEIGKEILSRL
ncbi:MAG: UDP-N-acetylmuramate--L-alanine ligase [bacterium]